jgi:DNA polymerase-1
MQLARNDRIHTSFNQTATSTGRLSSSEPNIQNIPIRTETGRRIRKGFIAEKNFLLISADYSQIELRLLAHITGDAALIKAFKEHKDIHRHTASLVFNIPEDKVDETKRRMAKVVNYGLIYGMSEFGLSHRLDIPHEEAIQFVESYYDLYSGVASWREQIIQSAEERGYVETLLGRRRPLPAITSRHYGQREFSKRAAVNTPIQGSAADLIKIAMLHAEKRLVKEGFQQGLLLSIHDELVFEIDENRIDEARDIIQEAMVHAMELSVPIEVTIGVGSTWDEAH